MFAHPSPQPLTLSPLAEHVLEEHLPDWGFVAASLGYDGALYILGIAPRSAFQPKKRYYGRFHIQTSELTDRHDYSVLRYTDHVTNRWTIPNQIMFYAFVQPLPADELLLVCPRAALYAPNLTNLNAGVFTPDGSLRCRFLVGDGIASVQTTGDGRIWTGYIDEGIFGNYGWGGGSWHPDRKDTYVEPIGVDGLRLWDSAGRSLYRYQPAATLDSIADCYALNVVADDTVMFQYYTDFPLVCLHDQRIAGVWYPSVQMAKAFAIWRQYALFVAEPKEQGIQFLLYALGDGAASELVGAFAPCAPSGKPLQGWVSARGDTCVILDDEGALYRIAIEELLARVGITP